MTVMVKPRVMAVMVVDGIDSCDSVLVNVALTNLQPVVSL